MGNMMAWADPLLPTIAGFGVVPSQIPFGPSSFTPWPCEGK